MPSDVTPSPESELIKAYVQELAPGSHEISCGSRLDGGYDLWIQLNPSSAVKQVIITKEDYRTTPTDGRSVQAARRLRLVVESANRNPLP